MKTVVAAVLLATLFPAASSACEMSDLRFLAADETLHYEFTQTKTVAALSQPLVSNGVLGLSANQELVWQTLRPLKSTLVIGGGTLKQFNRNDQLVNEMANPVAAELAQIFLSLLSGDTQALETAFMQNLTCEGSGWQLQLVPTDSDLQNILEALTLSGAEHIETISFRETRGDYTEILLSAPLAGPVENFATYLGD
jgi:hypothetical protein